MTDERIDEILGTEEELVPVVEVNVHPRIEGIAMLEQFWRSREIAEKCAGRRIRIEVQEADGIGV